MYFLVVYRPHVRHGGAAEGRHDDRAGRVQSQLRRARWVSWWRSQRQPVRDQNDAERLVHFESPQISNQFSLTVGHLSQVADAKLVADLQRNSVSEKRARLKAIPT